MQDTTPTLQKMASGSELTCKDKVFIDSRATS